ncbi:MAG: DNA (cytosine-5-)-methyltransferase [Mycoplasma sp.]|nr:DNA (cytosine-5-)-methyltransferase [Mycoplasma sp.]
MNRKIKFIDLFAGIGGFHLALESVAKKNNYDIECVFVSEIDKEAKSTYSKNFNFDESKMINIRDIKNISNDVPDHDFLFAGFPCQTFSNAGKKMGFLDEIRGTLFFEIVKILKDKKPKYILLENVKHLVNHDNGNTWKIINKKLDELGYIIPKNPLILSPHEFGIPQERKRVFIPGVLREKTSKKDKFMDIDFENNKLEIDIVNYKKQRKYIFNKFLQSKSNIDKKYLLTNNKNGEYLKMVFDAWDEFLKNVKIKNNRTLPVIWAYEFGQKYPIDKLPNWKQKYLQDIRNVYDNNKEFIDNWIKKYNVNKWNKREQKFEWQAGKDVESIKESFIQLRQSGIRCKRPIKFPTLVAMVQIPLIFDYRILEWRYLTPRETANLQSFPKKFKMFNEIKENNNDFYSYKQFGNSVNIEIVKMIQEYMLKKY